MRDILGVTTFYITSKEWYFPFTYTLSDHLSACVFGQTMTIQVLINWRNPLENVNRVKNIDGGIKTRIDPEDFYKILLTDTLQL